MDRRGALLSSYTLINKLLFYKIYVFIIYLYLPIKCVLINGLGVNDTISEESEKLRCPLFRFCRENIANVQIGTLYRYTYMVLYRVYHKVWINIISEWLRFTMCFYWNFRFWAEHEMFWFSTLCNTRFKF